MKVVVMGAGLAGVTGDWLFSNLQPALIAYAVFIGGILCPLAWLLGAGVLTGIGLALLRAASRSESEPAAPPGA